MGVMDGSRCVRSEQTVSRILHQSGHSELRGPFDGKFNAGFRGPFDGKFNAGLRFLLV